VRSLAQRQLLVKLVNEPQFHADCFAAALAQARKAALVTSDKDFQRAGTALKTIWVWGWEELVAQTCNVSLRLLDLERRGTAELENNCALAG
jgi:hypothetical protein